MSRHTQGSLAIVGAIAGAVFLVAFVAMYVLSEYSISAAVFLAILPATAAMIVLYRGFAGGSQGLSPAAPVSAPAPAPAPAPVVEAAPEPEPAPAPVAAAADGKPAGMDSPREGGADDLKKIKGVGPKLEKLLNSMGYWHFDQIAAWGASDVAWVDENLEGLKGRVSRDDWVAQAGILASGGETEFSKRS